uniref:G-protein coupled receptors family 1 profile domain-containing protein n=1 Tax=Maylandia zebra TaxID=106582 RepID=A0A3P9C7S2_9CICH
MLHPSSAAEPQNTTCHSQEHPAGEYGFFLLIYGTDSTGRRGQMALLSADFLLCVSLPMRVTDYASRSVIFRELYCSFGATSLYLNMYASIIFMGYIAADRYRTISNLNCIRTANIVSVVTWICLLAPSVTYGIMFLITQKPLTSIPNHCALLFSASVSLMLKIMHTFSAIIFLLVSISMVFFYYSTSRRVLQAQQRQLASGSEKLVKSRRNMLVLVSIFCVCFVPHHLVRVLFVFLLNSCSVDPVLYYLKEAATMVSVFNVCLDPLVYFFLCKTFWAQVRKAAASQTSEL